MERAIGSLAFEVPLRVNFGIDWRVLGVTLAVAGIAGIISGLAPALYARRTDVNTLLKTGGRTSAGAERGRLRGLLIVAQIAVSLVLLIVGGLFVKALERARNVDLGFRSDHVLLADVDLPRRSYTAAKRTSLLPRGARAHRGAAWRARGGVDLRAALQLRHGPDGAAAGRRARSTAGPGTPLVHRDRDAGILRGRAGRAGLGPRVRRSRYG